MAAARAVGIRTISDRMEHLETDYAAAVAVLEQGDRARSRAMFEAILSRWPRCHQAYFLHARASLELGEPLEAEAALRRALSLNPRNADYLRMLSLVLLRQHRRVEAAEAFEASVARSSPSAAASVEQANLWLSAGRPDRAAPAFRRAISLEPASERAWSGLVISLLGSGQRTEALVEARRFVERFPSSAEAAARLAMVHEQLGDLGAARAAAEKAQSMDAGHGLSNFMLGVVLHRMGDFHSAKGALERAATLAGSRQERPTILRLLGRTQEAMGEHDGAFRRFSEARPPGTSFPADARRMGEEFRQLVKDSLGVPAASALADWIGTMEPPSLSTPPIFIVGLPFAGATVLSRLLDLTGRFVIVDEIAGLGTVRERLSRDAGSVGSASIAPGHAPITGPRRLRDSYFMEVERSLGGADPIGKRLIDRDPINIAHLSIIRHAFPEAPVIVCLRDPRDAAMSAFINPSRRMIGNFLSSDLPAACACIADLTGLWEESRRSLGLKFCEVRYEALTASPGSEFARVMKFLGEEWSGSIPTETAPIRPSGIGRWRHYRAHFGGGLDVLRPAVESLGYDTE